MPHIKPTILLAAFLGMTSPPVHAQPAVPPVIPFSDKAPEISGQINPSEWPVDLGVMATGDAEEEFPETRAWMAMDRTHLYFAIRSAEPKPEGMVLNTAAEEINAPVWNDDSVEIFIDPGNTGKSIFHLVANAEGMVYDARVVNMRPAPNAWTSEAITQARMRDGAWEIEIAVPMRSMGHALQDGEVFSVNVARNRYAGGVTQRASIIEGRFHFPQHFKRLLAGGPVRAGGIAFISTRRGPFLSEESGVWEFRFIEGKPAAGSFEFLFPNERDGTPRKGPREAGDRFFTIPIPNGMAAEMNVCTVAHGGETVFSSQYEVQDVTFVPRVPVVADAVFDELIEPLEDGLAARGPIIWGHEFTRDMTKIVPFRWGMEYFQGKTAMENYARDRAMILATTGFLAQNPGLLELSKEYGVSWMAYPRVERIAREMGVPQFQRPGTSGSRVYTLDPRAREAFLQQIREILELSKEYSIAGIFAGDETWEIMRRPLVVALDRETDYPELDEIDREVRENHGFGKFGLPESSTDNNPHRWIATFRWEIEKMMEMANRSRALMDEEAPEMLFVSWDSISGHRPYAVSRWEEVFDIITGQIYPSSDKNRQNMGFNTKFYADLSGDAEVWPVPHIEHYPASFTPEEVEGLLSQLLRGGGTGLHLWTADHRNENVQKKGTGINERLGAPQRWNVVRSLLDRLEQQPFRVRQPEPDTAILYSNTSYQSLGFVGSTYNNHNHPEWIYTILGPRLKSAFRFVDEHMIAENPAMLDQFKIVYIPFMPFADDPEFQALERFVERGGTLVVCDPLAFRNRSDGTTRENGSILPPLKSTDPKDPRPMTPTGNGTALAAFGESFDLDAEGARVLGTYDRGAPAAVETTFGKGKIITLGQNPLVLDVITNQDWINFFGNIHKNAGGSGGHAVWDFRLPRPEPLVIERPDGLCLTGNYFEWTLSEPRPTANSTVGGVYRLSRAPQRGGERAGAGIRFENGRLTDRIKGARATNEEGAEDFVLSWNMDAPLEVAFEFSRAVKPSTVRMFYSGTLPPGSCEVSMDGRRWEKVAEWEAGEATLMRDVALEQLKFPAVDAKHVRLTFEPALGRDFVFVEADIWGRE